MQLAGLNLLPQASFGIGGAVVGVSALTGDLAVGLQSASMGRGHVDAVKIPFGKVAGEPPTMQLTGKGDAATVAASANIREEHTRRRTDGAKARTRVALAPANNGVFRGQTAGVEAVGTAHFNKLLVGRRLGLTLVVASKASPIAQARAAHTAAKI